MTWRYLKNREQKRQHLINCSGQFYFQIFGLHLTEYNWVTLAFDFSFTFILWNMFIILEFVMVGKGGFSLGEKFIAWKMPSTVLFKHLYSPQPMLNFRARAWMQSEIPRTRQKNSFWHKRARSLKIRRKIFTIPRRMIICFSSHRDLALARTLDRKRMLRFYISLFATESNCIKRFLF